MGMSILCLPRHCVFEAGNWLSVLTDTLWNVCMGYALKTLIGFLSWMETGSPTMITLWKKCNSEYKSWNVGNTVLSWGRKDKVWTSFWFLICVKFMKLISQSLNIFNWKIQIGIFNIKLVYYKNKIKICLKMPRSTHCIYQRFKNNVYVCKNFH